MSELIASILNLICHFIDDRATKLKKDQTQIEFDKRAYDFLKTSYFCWSGNSKSPTEAEQTVNEFINKFKEELLENACFLKWWNKKRYEYYIMLAQKHSSLWSNKEFQFIRSCQNRISKEMKWLARRIGKEDEYSKFEEQNKNGH